METCTLAGGWFRSVTAKLIIQKIKIPTEVHLIPDPQNMKDPNAIKVVYKDVHIGFIPKEQTCNFKKFEKVMLIPSSSEFDLYRPIIKSIEPEPEPVPETPNRLSRTKFNEKWCVDNPELKGREKKIECAKAWQEYKISVSSEQV
jgi:hypothetical protein